jgi:hypothetical protein
MNGIRFNLEVAAHKKHNYIPPYPNWLNNSSSSNKNIPLNHALTN